MTPTNESAAIQRGVALLDTFVPKWFTKLRANQFELSDPSMCVLGHVYGEYFDGLKELAEVAVPKALKATGLKISDKDENGNLVDLNFGTLDGNYYGFEPGTNKSSERMGQQWLHYADVRRKRAARARKRNATKQ